MDEKKVAKKNVTFFSDIGNTAKNQQKFVYFTSIFHNNGQPYWDAL